MVQFSFVGELIQHPLQFSTVTSGVAAIMIILAPEPLISPVDGSSNGVGFRQSILFFDVEVDFSSVEILTRVKPIIVLARLVIPFFVRDIPWKDCSSNVLVFLCLNSVPHMSCKCRRPR